MRLTCHSLYNQNRSKDLGKQQYIVHPKQSIPSSLRSSSQKESVSIGTGIKWVIAELFRLHVHLIQQGCNSLHQHANQDGKGSPTNNQMILGETGNLGDRTWRGWRQLNLSEPNKVSAKPQAEAAQVMSYRRHQNNFCWHPTKLWREHSPAASSRSGRPKQWPPT